jgi:hypothetical protein
MMNTIHFYYFDLSPDLRNDFIDFTHRVLEGTFRKYFVDWHGFSDKYVGKDMGFAVATKRGIKNLEVKGPTVSRGSKIVDFSIFLPENIETLCPQNPDDIQIYLDLVFSGIKTALARYGISDEEIERLRDFCRLELDSTNSVQ